MDTTDRNLFRKFENDEVVDIDRILVKGFSLFLPDIFSLETHSLERVRMCDVSRETCAWGRRVLSCDNSWIFAAVHTETTTELAAGVIASCSHLTYAPLSYRAIGGIRTAQHSLRGCPSYLKVSVRCYVNSNLHNNTAWLSDVCLRSGIERPLEPIIVWLCQ